MTNVCRAIVVLAALALPGSTGRAPGAGQPGHAAMLHAHNCYPEKGAWSDRIERALRTGATPIAIEQDVAWDGYRGLSVVSHEPALTGAEPSLEAHFFDRLMPLLERALAEGRRERWPLYVLHLDFKTNERAHHQAVWNLLGRYERFLTTAPRVADGSAVQPLTIRPLIALTENGDGQAATFHDGVPAGGNLRIFGTLPSALVLPEDREARLEAIFNAAPEVLIPGRATNYRRWANFPWAAVERGGQERAGGWTPADEARLRAIVDRAHAMDLWVRFYTLNGHAPGAGRGWTESYNFGSLDAVRPRWRAAIDARLDFVATDQYEEFARELARPTRGRRP